jgi:hypothetical protein
MLFLRLSHQQRHSSIPFFERTGVDVSLFRRVRVPHFFFELNDALRGQPHSGRRASLCG